MDIKYMSISDLTLSELNDISKELDADQNKWGNVSRAKMKKMKLTESDRRRILGQIFMRRMQISAEISYRTFTPVCQED